MPVAPSVGGHPAHRSDEPPNGHPHRDGADFPAGKQKQSDEDKVLNRNHREGSFRKGLPGCGGGQVLPEKGIQAAHNQIDEGGLNPPGAQSVPDEGSGHREPKKPVDSGLPKLLGIKAENDKGQGGDETDRMTDGIGGMKGISQVVQQGKDRQSERPQGKQAEQGKIDFPEHR